LDRAGYPESAMTSVPYVTAGRPFDSSDAAVREAGWEHFLRIHSTLLLHVARSFGAGHDEVMDRYTYLLEQLRRDDFRRLRGYAASERSEFSTWLVVVAQRIYLDHHRIRYGRPRVEDAPSPTQEEERAARRRLVDLISAEVDLDAVIDSGGKNPEEALRADETHRALAAALASLTPRDRLLIKLRFEDDLGMPEIARTLRMPTRFHAYRRLVRALADLRRALEASGIREANP
jgi:RNA polymerase sigma factor (sigma-70 family)